ncbi:Uncharacterized protein Rs2_24798 [Raphanus sativus]|uniref:Uncharacterized protein LOC108830333 isoform X3 n=1 Tax=Raphanus sativus TaxID=3726 RepID=A0A9W3BRS7_RAPSA|nr:uncharacterized protein LOC108830333 isoform X3 [Raphanus sativus]KAJ4898004.1 Uncharacterized protein Rs2_24798 [Raphanus sativus]
MVEETHRKGFDNESFTFNAREKDRRAAAGDSGKLRHEDMVLQKQRYVKVIVSVYNCKRYDYKTEEEENEYVEDKVSQEDVETFCNNTSTPLRLQPERMMKLESRAITQCLLEDEDIIE